MGSMVAGFITTVASLPLDIAKTRIQNMKTINGVPEYKGMLDVMAKVSYCFDHQTNTLFRLFAQKELPHFGKALRPTMPALALKQ